MAKGSIRAYADEDAAVKGKDFFNRNARAKFRSAFKATLRVSKSDTATVLKKLKWATDVELPDGLASSEWTRVISGTKDGFVKSIHLVQIAYVKRTNSLTAKLTGKKTQQLLWGDLVQITRPGTTTCDVRARGMKGKMKVADLTEDALLEVYFIDVGQGDGILVRTPDGRHILVDGGLERTKQQTGKNAADFVDWKFFADYGDFRVRLDSLMASHSDNDHYGGLHDLVRKTKMADRELDCLGVDIKTFHHPGLSRWSPVAGASPPHKQGLGANDSGAFVQLLDDRADAEKAVDSGSTERLSGPWKRFVADVLDNSASTKVERVILQREVLKSSGVLPKLWRSKADCDIRVLGPVATRVGGKPALPDFKQKSFNTNGHSICLRLDYGKARILLTGDLNSKSMNWLEDCYGDRMGAWECDVAKACHHGSHDISYRFLEKIHAAATIICSGDAEGHAHPRPEIVGASATTGFVSVDRADDKLATPLIFMTEVERSVSLGALNRLDIRKMPVDGSEVDGAILGRNIDELNDKAFLTPEDRVKLSKISDSRAAAKFVRDARKLNKPAMEAMELKAQTGEIGAVFNLTVPQGPISSVNVFKRSWRSRIMEKNHYGLVNVRTDGETIMCATLNETEKKWIVHSFPARFTDAGS